MEFISRLCDPVIVMAEGAVLATGRADEVRADEVVIEAYLGTGLKNKLQELVHELLIGEGMTCGYGGADILHGCTVGVDPGEIAVVVGPNGAGKSTAMKAMFACCRYAKVA